MFKIGFENALQRQQSLFLYFSSLNKKHLLLPRAQCSRMLLTREVDQLRQVFRKRPSDSKALLLIPKEQGPAVLRHKGRPVSPGPDRLRFQSPEERRLRGKPVLSTPAPWGPDRSQRRGELLTCLPGGTQENGQVPEPLTPTPKPWCGTTSGEQIRQETTPRMADNLPSSCTETASPESAERAGLGFQLLKRHE